VLLIFVASFVSLKLMLFFVNSLFFFFKIIWEIFS